MKTSHLLFAISMIVVFSLFSCQSFTRIQLPEAPLQEPLVVKKSAKGDYTLEFPEKGTHEVYLGIDSKNIDWSKPYFVTKESVVHLDKLPKGQRHYFGVKAKNDKTFIASERRIPIHSIVNLRDLGGLPTKDGKVTQWGKLYRSGKLADLSKKDMKHFSSLGIKTVVDFRNDIEIKKDPNKYPKNSNINYVRVVIGDKEGNVQEALKKQVMKNRKDPNFDSKAFVENVNREFIDKYAHQYIPLMELLMDESNYPLLFHCTAGKDRTGLAAAIILGAIGVDKKDIMDDFMMSNYYRNDHNNKVLRKMTLIGVHQNVAQPLLEVSDTYLQAAFDKMDENHGDMDTFLADQLGISDVQKDILQSQLLTTVDTEPAPIITAETKAMEVIDTSPEK